MEQNVLIDQGEDLAIVIGEQEAGELLGCGVSLLLCPVPEHEWNSLLSPWPADRIVRNAPPFAGHAEEYFSSLLPELQQASLHTTGRMFLCGYSLAGLFALYACTKTDLFDGCASVSGSLWYPGWTDWLRTHPVLCSRVYLSVGEKEKNTRNPIMRTVEDNTLACEQIISAGAETFFERNPGGHFDNPSQRLRKAISWLARK